MGVALLRAPEAATPPPTPPPRAILATAADIAAVARAVLGHFRYEHHLYRWRTVRVAGERLCVYLETDPERKVNVMHVVRRLEATAAPGSRLALSGIEPPRAVYYRVDFHGTSAVVVADVPGLIDEMATLYDRIVAEEDARRERRAGLRAVDYLPDEDDAIVSAAQPPAQAYAPRRYRRPPRRSRLPVRALRLDNHGPRCVRERARVRGPPTRLVTL